jgi:hypothetical protein
MDLMPLPFACNGEYRDGRSVPGTPVWVFWPHPADGWRNEVLVLAAGKFAMLIRSRRWRGRRRRHASNPERRGSADDCFVAPALYSPRAVF